MILAWASPFKIGSAYYEPFITNIIFVLYFYISI